MTRPVLRYILVAIYFPAGIVHLILPAPFLQIMPHWVAFPQQVVLFTGICEIVGSAALLSRQFRRAAGLAFALYAICVYPANIKHAVDTLTAAHPSVLAWAYHLPRLMAQPVLVWAAVFSTGWVTWPFLRRAPKPAAGPTTTDRRKMSVSPQK